MSARFASRTEQDIAQLVKEKNSKSTLANTKLSIDLLKQFCVAKELSFEELCLENSKLDGLLKSFYANVRKKDGSFYSKNTLTSLRYGLARYFLSEMKTDITSNSEFPSSNETFFAVATELKKLGKAKINHHPEITSQDLKKLYSCFNVTTPKGLQEKCLFDIIFFLVRRGRENLREQTKQTFAIAVDSSQRKYVYQAVDELNKNHRESDNPQDSVTDARMYEQRGNPLCPVHCFEMYLSKLNPGLDCLWQRPKQTESADENVWYDKVPVGKNTLGSFMKKLSRSAELSMEYTNHCIRATAVTVLDQNNFEARHIMRVSGHKSEASIRSYPRRLSEEKQRDISNSLSHYCGFPSQAISNIPSVPDPEGEPAAKVPELDIESSSSSIEISSQEYRSALDTVLHSPLPCSSLPSSPVLNSYSQKNTTKNENVSFHSGAFKNCNVTINFNYK